MLESYKRLDDTSICMKSRENSYVTTDMSKPHVNFRNMKEIEVDSDLS